MCRDATGELVDPPLGQRLDLVGARARRRHVEQVAELDDDAPGRPGRATAYAVQALEGGATPQAAQLAMAAAINPAPTAWAPLRAGAVNLCLPRGYDGKHAPELRQGQDVFAAAAQWRLIVEGNIAP